MAEIKLVMRWQWRWQPHTVTVTPTSNITKATVMTTAASKHQDGNTESKATRVMVQWLWRWCTWKWAMAAAAAQSLQHFWCQEHCHEVAAASVLNFGMQWAVKATATGEIKNETTIKQRGSSRKWSASKAHYHHGTVNMASATPRAMA